MSAAKRDSLKSSLFVLPALAIFGTFVVYPIIYNVQASTLQWDGINPGTFVGTENYVDLLNDPVLHTALLNSLWWILLTVIPQAVMGFGLAWLLNTNLRGRGLYRSLFFLPAILSPVVVGIVWQRLLDPSNGVLAEFGDTIGLTFLSFPFLSDPDVAIFALIGVNVWMWTGFSMLFYLAGLQVVDGSVLEAAKIDGAGTLQTIVRIVLPLLRNTHISLALLGVIGSLKAFELVYVMTEGGPNHATELLPTYAFKQAFQLQSVGYGATISIVLLLVAVGSSLLLMKIFGRGFLSGEET